MTDNVAASLATSSLSLSPYVAISLFVTICPSFSISLFYRVQFTQMLARARAQTCSNTNMHPVHGGPIQIWTLCMVFQYKYMHPVHGIPIKIKS